MLSFVRPCIFRRVVGVHRNSFQGFYIATTATAIHVSQPEASTIVETPPSPNPVPQPSPRLTSVSPSVLSYYYDTTRPTARRLRAADRFFTAHDPVLIFSAGKFFQVAETSVPEVAFLGRSNVGKSSLLNALMAKSMCYTSNKPGRTRTMNGFAVGGPDGVGNLGRLNVLDMPGYGKGSREEWGKEIISYLEKRKELRRAFLLVDAMHGLKRTDEQILQLFRHTAVPHQVILSKVDRVLFPKGTKKHITEKQFEKNVMELQDIVEAIRQKIQPKDDGPPALGEILTVCAEDAKESLKFLPLKSDRKLGIDSVRWAVLAATGFHQAV